MPNPQPEDSTHVESAIALACSDPMEARFAEAIAVAGMREPAVIALQIMRPISWVGAQLAWIAEPLLQGLVAGRSTGSRRQRDSFSIAGVARFLEGEGNIESLIDTLQSRPNSPTKPTSHEPG